MRSFEDVRCDFVQVSLELVSSALRRWPVGSGLIFIDRAGEKQLATVEGVRMGRLFVVVSGDSGRGLTVPFEKVIEPRPLLELASAEEGEEAV